MRKWIEENKLWLISVGIIILVGVPSVVYLLVMIPLFPAGANNDWAGFWGGYAGAIIGGIITLYVMFKSLRENKKSQDKIFERERSEQIVKEKIEFCNYIVSLFAELEECTDRLIDETFDYIKTGNIEICLRAKNYAGKVKRISIILNIQLSIKENDSNYVEVNALKNSIGLFTHMLYHIVKYLKTEPENLNKIDYVRIGEFKKNTIEKMKNTEKNITCFCMENLNTKN